MSWTTIRQTRVAKKGLLKFYPLFSVQKVKALFLFFSVNNVQHIEKAQLWISQAQRAPWAILRGGS